MSILMRDSQSKKWRTLASKTYTDEEELKKLLVESPEILPTEDLAVSFVVAVPEFGLGSGAADMVMFGTEGNVAIVECKLDKNPEIKRKVIGQIFEYASYLWGMSYEQVDLSVHQKQGKSLVELVRDKTEGDWDEENFRNRVKSSLEKGNFFLIIAVDKINKELKRTVQYFSQCMNCEYSFYALEMRHFKGEYNEILIPHLHPESPLPPPKSPVITWEEFLKSLRENQPGNVAEVVESLYDWAKREEMMKIDFGKSSLLFYVRGISPSIFYVSTKGRLYLNYGSLLKPVGKATLAEFHNKHGIKVLDDFSKFPGEEVSEALAAKPEAVEKFKEAIIWLAKEIRKLSTTHGSG